MRWRRVTLMLCAMLAAFPGAGHTSVRKVAIVLSRSIQPYEEAAQGIETYLAELPEQVVAEYFLLPDERTDQDALAIDIRARGIELVFPVGTEAYRSLAARLQDIPMIISMVYDPQEEFDLHPDRQANIYAANLRVPFEQQLRIVKEFLPDRERVAALHMGSRRANSGDSLTESAHDVGMQATPIALGSLKDLEQALVNARSAGDIFLMVLDKEIYSPTTTRKILLFFARNRIPVISPSPNLVKAGALISISSLYRENGVTAAKIGAALLNGQPIVEHFVPTDGISIAWNDHVATALGIELPDAQRRMCDVIY